jgi:hypothetical protein
VRIDAAGRRALRSVLETARRELRELDDREVPHRLRKVAASSSRSLPPPLERTLVEVLVDDDAFRGRVRERWTADGADDRLGTAFLEEPEVAIEQLGKVSDVAEHKERESRIARLERDVSSLRAELEEAKRRTAQARADSDDELARLRAADKAARRGLEVAVREARAAEAEARAEARSRSDEIESLRARITELEAQIDRRDERERRRGDQGAARQGRDLVPAPPSSGLGVPGGSPPADSLGLAIWLDGVERSARPYRDPALVSPERAGVDAIGLPPGVAPDRGEAVDAIIRMDLTDIILDGYNIGGIIAPGDFAGRSGRDRVVALATPLARLARAAVTVVFDAVVVDGRESADAPLGVTVRFSKDRSADDLIVVMAADGAGGVAVVTNDRDLRERAAAVGAVVVWSDALVEWGAKP